jgi:hypothetical protein
MVAVPSPTPFTTPLDVTVATFLLEVFQTTFLLTFFLGVIVAFRDFLDPTARLKFPVFNLTFLTAAFLTTTFTTAFFFLFFLETTVILALPAFTPLMYPLEDTVATFLLEVLYVTFLLPFLFGLTVTVVVILTFLPFAT